MDHSAIRLLMAILLTDVSDKQMPTVKVNCLMLLFFISALHPAMNKTKTITGSEPVEEKVPEAAEETDIQNTGDIEASEPEKKTDHLLHQADHRRINLD